MVKIVGRKTFLSMPSGILFSKYKPCVFGDLSIKGKTLGSGDIGDYYYQQISDAVKADSSAEFSDILFKVQEKGISFEMDFDCEDRDGIFDRDQLFVVWEKLDVELLIGRFKKALVEGYEEL